MLDLLKNVDPRVVCRAANLKGVKVECACRVRHANKRQQRGGALRERVRCGQAPRKRHIHERIERAEE